MFERLKEVEIHSRWIHTETQRKCTVVGKLNVGERERYYTFHITGWNPLPCKSFTGGYLVLAKWLTENGWKRDISTYEYGYDVMHHVYK